MPLAHAKWFTDSSHVDASGRAVELPAEGSGRIATQVKHEGRAVAAIVDEASLCEELRASRARLVEAGDAERRRLQRNLHDGAQQRLVSLLLNLKLARRRAVTKETVEEAREALLDEVEGELSQALVELRALASGTLPPVLSDRGLEAAIEELASHSPLAVRIEEMPGERLPERVEAAAYFIVSEALTNVAKHARASRASVRVDCDDSRALVEVSDDGVGGARLEGGSGLRGLADRVGALEGSLELESPAGQGTTIRAEIPCGL